MNKDNEVALQIKNLVLTHGRDFWNAIFDLMNPVGLCECGRPPHQLLNIGRMHYAICPMCRTYRRVDHHFEQWDQNPDQWMNNDALLRECRQIEPKFPWKAFIDAVAELQIANLN